MTDRSNLSMPPHSTAADLKTLDFPAASEFLLATSGEMAYVEDLKSSGAKARCGFDPPPPAFSQKGFLSSAKTHRICDHRTVTVLVTIPVGSVVTNKRREKKRGEVFDFPRP